MDMIALVDDVHAGVQPAQFCCIGAHRHTRRRDAITRAAGQVIAVRNATNGLVTGRAAHR